MNATVIDERHAVQAGISGRIRALYRRLSDYASDGAPFAGALLNELRQLEKQQPQVIGSALRFRDGLRTPAPELNELEVTAARLASLESRVALLATPAPRMLTPLPTPEPEPIEDEPERRGEDRARLQTAVTLDSGSNFFIGFTRNISRGGLFLACEDPLRQDTPVEIVFTLPGGRRIEATAEVSWVRERAACGEDVQPGMGVRFVYLKEADRRAIRTFMRLREPLFYPE